MCSLRGFAPVFLCSMTVAAQALVKKCPEVHFLWRNQSGKSNEISPWRDMYSSLAAWFLPSEKAWFRVRIRKLDPYLKSRHIAAQHGGSLTTEPRQTSIWAITRFTGRPANQQDIRPVVSTAISSKRTPRRLSLNHSIRRQISPYQHGDYDFVRQIGRRYRSHAVSGSHSPAWRLPRGRFISTTLMPYIPGRPKPTQHSVSRPFHRHCILPRADRKGTPRRSLFSMCDGHSGA